MAVKKPVNSGGPIVWHKLLRNADSSFTLGKAVIIWQDEPSITFTSVRPLHMLSRRSALRWWIRTHDLTDGAVIWLSSFVSCRTTTVLWSRLTAMKLWTTEKSLRSEVVWTCRLLSSAATLNVVQPRSDLTDVWCIILPKDEMCEILTTRRYLAERR